MSAENETFTVEEILSWSPTRILQWLDTVNVGDEIGGRTFHWEGLAFTAASRASSPDLVWARISSRIYEALIERRPSRASGYTLSLMNLRANMIRSFGADPQDDLLNPDRIAQWCASLRIVPLDEASRISPEHWGTTSTDVLLALRQMKTALNVLARIADYALLARFPELQPWLAIRQQLP